VRSWESAYDFIRKAFGITQYESAQPASFDSVMAVEYNDTDGTQLKGWLAMPNSEMFASPGPAVVILPDWDGVNDYEKERAVALARLGYVAFAADIYGKDKQDLPNIDDRITETTFYGTNPDVYFSRIQSAIDQVKMMDSNVISEEIALIGYCFGGTVSSTERDRDARILVFSHV
jgi:dienelactone hydrolase